MESDISSRTETAHSIAALQSAGTDSQIRLTDGAIAANIRKSFDSVIGEGVSSTYCRTGSEIWANDCAVH